MSSIWQDAPTLKINAIELQNIVSFIYKHERVLNEFGAIKIQPTMDCKLALKKRQKKVVLYPDMDQIVKISEDELLYSVEKADYIAKRTPQSPLIIDEPSFWSSLSCSSKEQRQTNISLLPNKSFFCHKSSGSCFDIHRLPFQSVLKVGGSKVTRQFVPCVRRAHGPGAFFPLTCTKQRLLSLDYHHEGGAHHWYIIPTRERDNLRGLMERKNSSMCFDHGKLLIDPSVLDKNHIRYHRIVQHPNEFVVLAAGTMAQSFVENASWSESISFALPSWIGDGHAIISDPFCQCNISQDPLPQIIDVTSFRHELIQRYITLHLNNIDDDKPITITDDNNVDTVAISTPNRTSTNLSKAQIMMATNARLIIPLEQIGPSFKSPSTSLITPLSSTYFSKEDNKKSDDNGVQVQEQLLEEGTFQHEFDWNSSTMTLIDSISSEHLSESDTGTSHPLATTTTSANMYRNFTNNFNADNYSFWFEELMDILPCTTDDVASTYRQFEEDIDTSGPSTVSSNTYTTPDNKRSHVKKEQVLKQKNYTRKTLFVSGLRKDLNKRNIRRHFIGCVGVTIKQYHSTPNLKYAFIHHLTAREAQRNLRRPIDYSCLGPKCRVEYVKDCSSYSSNYQSFGNRKLTVRQIPENVSEDDLHRLFIGGHILKYCPARAVNPSATAAKMGYNCKVLSGYAFILYDDEQQAASVIQHADQYHINSQPLAVSVYREKNSSNTTTRKMFVN